ncbi:MAG: TetR/AcrR family transcriptional regulator [Clostridium sp.]|nr:TetR/AcrR family transcriptional regulator [Clostridium sp.]
MSNFTKPAIVDSFIRLSEQMPIDKITVTKITKECGINRNTFYYYYNDVYDLLEEIIYTKMQKLFVIDENNYGDSWKASLRLIGQYAIKNEEFIKALYHSMGRDAFGDKLTSIAEEPIRRTLMDYVDRQEAVEEDIRNVAYAFAKAFAELAVEWIRGRLNSTPVETMETVIKTLGNIPDMIIKNISKK